jgi:outer membrane protein OmpA-like peptidoglycan-associated protein
VYFTKGSYELSDAAKALLDKLGENGVVDVKGYADEVGSEKFNQALSEKRAKTVADYLTNRGLKVNSVNAYGETGDIVARVVVVSPTK